MDNEMMQPDPALHKVAALMGIALELKYGTLDQLLAEPVEQAIVSEDKIKNIEEQIGQLKERSSRLEAMLLAIDEIMPKIVGILGSDPQEALCPGSDPRKEVFFQVWDETLIVVGDWQRLSASYSEKEKTAFMERALSLIDKLGLWQIGISDLYPGRTP